MAPIDLVASADSQPLVSIIMLTYGRPQYLRKAVDSIREQSYRNWELLLVHDGDHPETMARAREIVALDDRVRHLHRSKGGNIANATNHGLENARGEYVAILDDDDLWIDRDKLSKQVAFMASHPGCVACGAGMIVVDLEGVEKMRYLKPDRAETIRKVALTANPMAHSTILYRRGAALDVGGYDESLPGYQDWDLWLKLGQKGSLHNFPGYFSAYRMWPGGGSTRNQRANAWSAIRIVWRHKAAYPRAWLALPLSLAYGAFTLLPRGLRETVFIPLSRAKKRLFSR